MLSYQTRRYRPNGKREALACSVNLIPGDLYATPREPRPQPKAESPERPESTESTESTVAEPEPEPEPSAEVI